MSEHVLVNLAGIIILGITAQWLAWRLKFPSILFLLLFGFIAGPVTGFLQTDELMGPLLLPFVSLSVAVILFEGGLTLNIKELREIGGVVVSLITIGTLITWIVASITSYYVLGLNLEISILLGAILVVTGPTVIGPLLRQIRPSDKVADILKWEGIVIDPIGALLAVLVFEAILPGELKYAGWSILISLGKTVVTGGVFGFLFAGILILFLKKFWVPDFLQEAVTLMLVVAAFLVSDIIQSESGLFSVTLMGIVVANQKYVTVKHILEFKENLSVLIISMLFIILSSRMELTVLSNISYDSFLFLAIIILVARPLSVFISSIGKGINLKEKFFLSAMAPRGIVAAAVASIFALRLSENGVQQSEFLVPITFIVIVGTVTIYGLSSPLIARWLNLSQSNSQGIIIVGARSWALEIAKVIQGKGFKVAMIDTNRSNITKARMSHIPAYYGSVISEGIMDKIHFDGIGKLLALTSNDEANSLAFLHFKELFNREDLYQLPPDLEDAKDSPNHLHGRYLFGEGINFSFLRQRFSAGYIIKSTKLTEEFDIEDFKNLYGDTALPLFLITEKNELIVLTSESKVEPKLDQTIVALVKEK